MLPAISPDGSRVCFYTRAPGLVVINTDGSGLKMVVAGAMTGDWVPAVWSPDATRIALVHAPAKGSLDVYTVKPDGTDLTRLSNVGPSWFPTWAPDGTRLAFISPFGEVPGLYVVSADATGLSRITRSEPETMEISWSPDGARILFAQGRNLYTITPEGTDLAQLTHNEDVKGLDIDGASWSPDSKRIAFYGALAEGRGLYVMNADGTRMARLADTAVPMQRPAWAPRPVKAPEAPDVSAQATEAAALVEKAAVAKRENRLAEAEKLLRQALGLDPKNVQAHWLLAWILAGQDQKAQAAEEFRKVIELATDEKMKREAQQALDRLK
jgi:Tol biopolymer transport system component